MNMNWNALLAENKVSRHKTTARELHDIRSVVERNLADAQVKEISTDIRFALSYEAVLLLSKMAIACCGYRVKGAGAHQTTFIALPLACGSDVSDVSLYFDTCRKKRNKLAYDKAGIVTETEASELYSRAMQFREFIEAWIKTNHPEYTGGD
jgi:hypothetical protein